MELFVANALWGGGGEARKAAWGQAAPPLESSESALGTTRSTSGALHLGQFCDGFFPLFRGGGDEVGHRAELAVEVLEFAFVGVGLGGFEGGGDFGLLGFEFDDLLFEDSDVFAEFADFARAGFGFAGRGGCGDGRGFFDFGLFRAVVGEAGGEGDAGVAGFGFVQEVFVVAGVVGELAAVDVEDVFREGLDEVNVVRDEDERALVFAKGHHECVDRLDVQVRRGLVHEEQVGRADENAGEGKAGFFAAGEDGDGLEDVVLGRAWQLTTAGQQPMN